MAGEIPGLQYYDTSFEYSIENKNSGVNLQYHRIVNYTPTKHPNEYFGYQKNLDINPDETGDRPFFAMRTREGMTNVMAEQGFYITDTVILNGQLYVMWRSDSNTTMKIAKYETEYIDECDNLFGPGPVWNKLCETDLENVTSCTPDYMLKIRAPYGRLDSSDVYSAKLKHTLVGNTIVATVVEMAGGALNVQPGDLILVSQSNDPSVITGYYRQVTGNFNNETQIFGKWLGLNDYAPTVAQNSDGTTVTTWNGDPRTVSQEINVYVKVYKTVDETVAFVNDTGMWYINAFDCDTSNGQSPYQKEAIPQAQTQFPITGFSNWNNDGIAFISNGYANFSSGGENFGIFTYSIPVGKKYTDFLPIQQYTMILGPQSMGVIYQSALDRFGTPIPKLFDVKTDIGYFNKGSYQRYFYDGTEDFIIYQSDGTLARYIIEPYDNGLGGIYFRMSSTPIGNRFIDSDLTTLSRKKGDKVFIYRNKNGFALFLTDSRGSETQGTKVIFFDDKYKFYYRWYICGLHVRGEKYGLYFGNKGWINTGDTDDGNVITSVINGQFGNVTQMSNRLFDSICLLIGGQSVITPQNTKLVLHNHVGGFVVEHVLDDLTRPLYVSMLNRESRSGKDEELIEEIPAGIGIYGSLPATRVQKQYADLGKDLDALCAYDPSSPIHGGICDELHVYRKLYIDKVAMIREKLSWEGDQIDFELVSTNKDKFTLVGLRIAYLFTDTELRNPNNVIGLAGLTKKSYPTPKKPC